MVRTISFYFTQQYFKAVEEGDASNAEFDLEGLKKLYDQLEIVNDGLNSRIHQATSGDANKNAIVTLNLFAQLFKMGFNQDFSSVKKFFDPVIKTSE